MTTELCAWYRAADVFCLPSVARSEAFGLVQIEAHAAGTPGSVYPTPYRRALRQSRRCHRAHSASRRRTRPLRAALTRLLSDDDLRTRLGQQAQARALREFTVPRMVKNTMDVYAEAIDRYAASAHIAPATGGVPRCRAIASSLFRSIIDAALVNAGFVLAFLCVSEAACPPSTSRPT